MNKIKIGSIVRVDETVMPHGCFYRIDAQGSDISLERFVCDDVGICLALNEDNMGAETCFIQSTKHSGWIYGDWLISL